MPQTVSQTIENNFTGGLKTEFTGLNFPDHAATDTDNCFFDIVGDVTRRLGYDYEENFELTATDRTNKAISTYKWNNVGGDGTTQVVVKQVGSMLYFYESSSATALAPLSTTLLASTVDISTFRPTGSALTVEDIACEFASGNGYLFVYHPHCNPFYCTYNAGSIFGTEINVKIRDFAGINEGVDTDRIRPAALSDQHLYNLTNQGWTQGGSWQADSYSLSFAITTGIKVFVVNSGLPIVVGQSVSIYLTTYYVEGGQQTFNVMSGIVSAYTGGNLTIIVNAAYPIPPGGNYRQFVSIYPRNIGYIDKWNNDIGSYPSNADVWWRFKDASNVFAPATQIGNFTLASPAPKGSFIVNAFNQDRSLVSNVPSLTPIKTNIRPRTGAWFQGRVWYAGVDSSQAAFLEASFYTWTENIYFSQVVTTEQDLERCYQTNDPTSEDLFNLLPTDGGTIQIQGCGSIFKLFPIQNGMLVFAANGIWFITGSQGIGFTANDYTITKISSIQAISSSSFVNVNGLPVFWNEEGIYTVSPAQQGLGLTVESLTVTTINRFFADIPLTSKLHVKGDYNPLEYIVQWIYRSEEESDVTSRYEYDRVLCFNTNTKAFYPYTIARETGYPHIHAINYVASPGGSGASVPTVKYLTSALEEGLYNFTFAEERDENYVDWDSATGDPLPYESYFITGYKLKGNAQTRFQPMYVRMYSRSNDEIGSYRIQGIWDFAADRNSGKWSSPELVQLFKPYFGMIARRHKIRGQGLSLQLKLTSVDNYPFDLMGWAVTETVNSGA